MTKKKWFKYIEPVLFILLLIMMGMLLVTRIGELGQEVKYQSENNDLKTELKQTKKENKKLKQDTKKLDEVEQDLKDEKRQNQILNNQMNQMNISQNQ